MKVVNILLRTRKKIETVKDSIERVLGPVGHRIDTVRIRCNAWE